VHVHGTAVWQLLFHLGLVALLAGRLSHELLDVAVDRRAPTRWQLAVQHIQGLKGGYEILGAPAALAQPGFDLHQQALLLEAKPDVAALAGAQAEVLVQHGHRLVGFLDQGFQEVALFLL